MGSVPDRANRLGRFHRARFRHRRAGWIGSAVIPELIDHGHTVLGLARSDASAEKVATSGAEVLRGDVEDLDVLRSGAEQGHGVVHLAFRRGIRSMSVRFASTVHGEGAGR